jgi:hypothetical protein
VGEESVIDYDHRPARRTKPLGDLGTTVRAERAKVENQDGVT